MWDFNDCIYSEIEEIVTTLSASILSVLDYGIYYVFIYWLFNLFCEVDCRFLVMLERFSALWVFLSFGFTPKIFKIFSFYFVNYWIAYKFEALYYSSSVKRVSRSRIRLSCSCLKFCTEPTRFLLSEALLFSLHWLYWNYLFF